MTTWDWTSSGAILEMAGANVSTATVFDSTSGQRLARAYDKAEGYVFSETKIDWSSKLSSIGANFSGAVASVITSKAAIDMINFDMSGYTSRSESRTMLNMNHDNVRRGIAFLKEADHKTKMGVL